MYLVLDILAVLLFSNLLQLTFSLEGKEPILEFLSPYIHHHGSRLNHRSIRDCHQKQYGTEPRELYIAHKSVNITHPVFIHSRFVKEISRSLLKPKIIRGHYIVIPNPMETLSVLEPNETGGCSLKVRQTVVETAKNHGCSLAVNAGYFNTKTGTCLGNVVSDGRKAQDSNGIQNAHFGLTATGQIFTGYLSEEQFISVDFEQLVGGVIWLLRNGSSFVNTSKFLECEDTEETGRMEDFVNILSARTAVGHDKEGQVVIVQVDGKSAVDGVSLNDMQQLLQEFGLINAINLDGGGSSTVVMNGVTVNYPYDECPGGTFACDRKVSTILCVHDPYCSPADCNNNGRCEMGTCICRGNWLPPHCDQLLCKPNNCTAQGICTEQGCVCNPGYYGKECDKMVSSSPTSLTQKEYLLEDTMQEKRKLYATLITLGIITAICVTSCILLLFCSCSCHCRNEQLLCNGKAKKKYVKYPSQASDSSDSESVPMKNFRKP